MNELLCPKCKARVNIKKLKGKKILRGKCEKCGYRLKYARKLQIGDYVVNNDGSFQRIKRKSNLPKSSKKKIIKTVNKIRRLADKLKGETLER